MPDSRKKRAEAFAAKKFSIGDHVRAPCGTVLDPADKLGTVESYFDWWIMVRMIKSHMLMPFLPGELEHVQ